MAGPGWRANYDEHQCAHAFKKRRAAIGFLLTDDRFGVSEHTRATFVYAYALKLGKGKLSFGLQGGVDMIQNNWNQVKTTQDRDPSFAVNAERKIVPQAGTGIYFYTKNFYTGASAPELLELDDAKFRTLTFTTGGVLNANGDFKIKPVVLMRYMRNSPLDVNLSTTFYWKDYFGLGLGL